MKERRKVKVVRTRLIRGVSALNNAGMEIELGEVFEAKSEGGARSLCAHSGFVLANSPEGKAAIKNFKLAEEAPAKKKAEEKK